ncbi:MAG TPA: ribonuclease HII [Thermoflexia bacterium]|nr:ribonuclease HII [Thermoflexia bacterium]
MNAQPRPSLQTERALWQAGYRHVAGLDEAGRGAWAGPVYAAAVIFPQFKAVPELLAGVRDSKLLSARQREAQFERIVATAWAYGVGCATAEEIDQRGIVPSTKLAMRRALAHLEPAAQALIIDVLQLPAVLLPQRSFPRADALSLTVAAASILAKVSRDRWMATEAATRFPGYGFAQHKGYGTAQHRTALDKLGVTTIHRRTFRPIAARLL